MDETFMLFLNDIPAENQGFVLELDNYLTSKGSKRTIKSAKSGFVTSYASPVTGKTLLNYVFRKTGVKMRIYAQSIGEHSEILADLPEKMKTDVKKENNPDTGSVYITQKHIRQIQLAKAAVRCGIDYLVEKFGCTMQEIDHVYVAGGFGYYLDIEAAFGVGLLPEAFKGKTTACGNTALSGAAWYGYSKIKKNLDDETVVNSKDQTDGGTSEKKEINTINIINDYVNLDRTLINLANEPDFSERYISYLDFEK